MAPPSLSGQTGAQGGDFYVVRGVIELPDFVLDYFIERCTDQKLLTLVQDTQPFTADHALDQITTVAHAIAFRLEQSSPPTAVVVQGFEVESENPEQKDVQDAMRRKVSEAVSESSDLLVADTGDYRVGGWLTFEKAGARIRLRAKWDMVQGDVYILAHEKKYPLPRVEGSREELPKFYGDVATEVVRDLPQVLLAEHLGWSSLLGNMETKALLSRAAQLLDGCSSDVRTCDGAQDAIPLLATATQKDPSSEKGFRLLGQAQMWAGNYAGAAKSLEKARNLIGQKHRSGTVVPPKDETEVLNLLGDAYRNRERYPQAEAVYSESLRIGPAQLDVYTSKALALRYDGKLAAALGTLLAGLEFANSKDSLQSLHSSAKDTIRALLPEEFPQADRSVTRAAGKGIHLADEYALLISREQGAVLDTKWTPETAEKARGPLKKALDLDPPDPDERAQIYGNLARTHLLDKDPKQIVSYLTQAEKLPPDQVSPDTREWIARIRARFWLNQKAYDKAYAAAESARQIHPTDEGAFMLAAAASSWADKIAGTNPTPEQKGEIAKLYQQTADLTRPLVEKRFPGADGFLIEANHALGLDANTRGQFEGLVKHDPKDDSALNGVIVVCSQYLFDFDCAFSAAKLDAVLHDTNGPDAADAYVNLAEVGILANEDVHGQSWLGIALKQPGIAPREKALAYLYALWLALRQGHTNELSADFGSWQKAAEEFRQTNTDLNWLFLGARKQVHESQIEGKRKALLLAMMDALEDTNKPIPAWTD